MPRTTLNIDAPILGNARVSTMLVGYSSLEQLEYAARWVEKGPLPGAALERLTALLSAFASESGSSCPEPT